MALNTSLAELVNGLINEKVPEEKLAHLQETYLRPNNCPYLISPRINKQIWQQLRQETHNSYFAFEKDQGFLICQICQNDESVPMDHLIHAVVLLMSANRELNLKRGDLLRPDLNKQYGGIV